MPIEVIARLDREAAIYLAGETIHIKITVKNVASKMRTKETLAWGSVQLTSERTMGSVSSLARERPTTSMTRSAATVYSSKPNILFCDLMLGPGEAREFMCEIPLSRDAIPPTFRGHLVRYSNKVTVAVSHVQAHIKLANLPIRIIPSVGLEAKMSLPSNPFLASSMVKATVSESVMATVDELTTSRKGLAFALTHATSQVALLTLPKKAFRLGEDVCAHLDFSCSQAPCMQYSISIETEERLIDPDVDETSEPKRKSLITQAQTTPITAFSSDSAFRLNIPLSAPPTFSTDSVQVKWRLRFVFVVASTANRLPYDAEQDQLYSRSAAPLEVEVESFSWATDILVLPCQPHNAALLDNSFTNNVAITV